MKKILNNNYQKIIGLLIVVLAISGCNEGSDLGIEILPKDDLISVKNTVIKETISSFTFTEDTIRTDNSSSSLLGFLTDPVFGTTSINYATQFRLQSFPEFGTNPVADSIKLILRYSNVYGDTTTAQTFKVYELISDLDVDSEYDQHVDLKSMASDYLLGEVSYLPKIEIDTTDNGQTYLKQQIISVPLDISLGERLVNADSLDLINNDVFLEFFKGLFIETESLIEEGGAILTLNELTTSDYLGSGVVLYYNNEENNAEEPDTMFIPLLVSEFSARINSMKHDYSGTPFEDFLNSEVVEDSLIYIQATGGLKSKIHIDDLASWKDSTDMAINKAQLIFQVDTLASDVENYPPPSQLLFTVVNEDGEEFLPIDYVFDPDYYGGALDTEDYTYRFNITQHLQQIIDGSADNYGFFLTPANKNNEANRVVLKGSKSKTGIKFVVTYSKFTK